MKGRRAVPALFADELVVIRGGGDIATGIGWRLSRAGFPVVVCELDRPLTVRRAVSFSSAVLDDSVTVEGVTARVTRARDERRIVAAALSGDVAVIVSPALPRVLTPTVVIDARIAKINIDTTIEDAALVIGIGPGFTAGVDCHAVIETVRGSHLGRVFWTGSAQADTGDPGEVGGRRNERVLRAARAGVVDWRLAIGELVVVGDLLGEVGGAGVRAPFSGVIRGLIAAGTQVPKELKIGDIDPRKETRADEISDKSLAVGGGALEAVLTFLNQRSQG